MFCTSCGASVPGRYCPNCGAPASATVTATNPHAGKNAQIVGQFLAICGALGLVWALAGEQPHAVVGILSLVLGSVGALMWAAGKAEHWYHAE